MAALDFPDSPTVGQTYGSAGTVWRWDGTAWQSTAGASGARGTVAYAQVTANQTGITLLTDIAGLSVTFNVVAGRTYHVTGAVMSLSSVAGDGGSLQLLDGGALAGFSNFPMPQVSTNFKLHIESVFTAAASGSRTFKLAYQRYTGSGTHQITASATYPAFILVEDITYEAGSSGTPYAPWNTAWGRVASNLFTQDQTGISTTETWTNSLVYPNFVAGRLYQMYVVQHVALTVPSDAFILKAGIAGSLVMFEKPEHTAFSNVMHRTTNVVAAAAGSGQCYVSLVRTSGTGTANCSSGSYHAAYMHLFDVGPVTRQ